MNVQAQRSQVSATDVAPVIDPMRLHKLARRAINASTALTCASTAGRAITDAHYAEIDHTAQAARLELLDCLKQDYGIDKTMADQLSALL